MESRSISNDTDTNICVQIWLQRDLISTDLRTKDIIDYLLCYNVISQTEREIIEHKVTTVDQTNKLLDIVLNKPPDKVDGFKQALLHVYPSLWQLVYQTKVTSQDLHNYTSYLQHTTSDRIRDHDPNDLSDQFADSQKKHKPYMICNICGHADITAYCFTCINSLCGACNHTHNCSKRYKNHVKVTFNKDTMLSLVCPEHHQSVDAFCTQCLTSVCKKCQLTSHNLHNIEDFSNNYDAHLIRHIQRAHDTLKESLTEKLHAVDKIQEEFNNHIEHVRDDITKHKDTLLQQIEHQNKMLQSNLSTYQTDTNTALDKFRREIQNYVEDTENKTRQCHKLAEPLIQFPNITLHDLSKYLNKISQETRRVFPLIETSKYCFNPESDSIAMGHISDVTDPSWTIVEDSSHYGSQILSTLLTKALDQELNLPSSEFDDMVDGPIPGSSVCRSEDVIDGSMSSASVGCKLLSIIDCKITQIKAPIEDFSFLPNGHMLAIVGQSLVVYKSGQNKPIPFDVSHIYTPLALSVHHTSCTAVVAHGSRFLCSFTLYSLSTGTYITRTIHGPAWAVASAVAFTPDGDFVVGMGGRQALLKYSAKGDKLWRKKLSHPSYNLTVDSQNRIIIAYRKDIFVYDSDGNIVFCFPCQTDKVQLCTSCAVCTDNYNNILVADRKNQIVAKFKSNGIFIQNLVVLHGEPRCMALNQGIYLTVAMLNGRLCRYKIS